MRAVLGLFTALPIEWDPDDAASGWVFTPVAGVLLGIVWLVFHQAFIRVGGPFVGAVGVLALHVVLTGARTVRGVAAVATEVTLGPEDLEDAAVGRAVPDAAGAGTAMVTLLLLVMSSFLILLDVAPATLVLVPLIGRLTQALLLSESDELVGVRAPTPAQRVVVVVGGLVAMGVAPLMSVLVRPVRTNAPLVGPEYLLAGAIALAVAVLAGMLARMLLRARFGGMDANGWHAVGAVADLVALGVLASRAI